MKVTVLGKSPSWADAGGACSGYLVQAGETNVLLDCGNGVFGKLRERLDYLDVDAVLISHLHADHWLDLIPFAYALTYSPRRVGGSGGTDASGVDRVQARLVAPPGAGGAFRRVVGAWGGEELIEDAFALEEYRSGDELWVGSLDVSFHPVPHSIETHAIRVREEGGGLLAFGADSRPSEAVVEAGRDADLMIVEGTLNEPDSELGHMTPAEAGEHAARAGAKRVLITHISDELDAERAREQAAAAFGGPVEIAREGATVEI